MQGLLSPLNTGCTCVNLWANDYIFMNTITICIIGNIQIVAHRIYQYSNNTNTHTKTDYPCEDYSYK